MNQSDKKTWSKPSIQDLDSKFNAGGHSGKSALSTEGFVTTTTAAMIMLSLIHISEPTRPY